MGQPAYKFRIERSTKRSRKRVLLAMIKYQLAQVGWLHPDHVLHEIVCPSAGALLSYRRYRKGKNRCQVCGARKPVDNQPRKVAK